jgi:hypothetical protein
MLHYLSTRWGRSGVLLAVTLVGALAFTSSPALAAGKYVFNTKFQPALEEALVESSDGSFYPDGGIAIDKSSSPSAGDIYVINESIVDKLEVTGSGASVKVKLLCELGGSNLPLSAKPCSGTQAPEEVTFPTSIAVGPNGEVFALNGGIGRIDEWDSSGAFVRAVTGWSADASTGTSAGTFDFLQEMAVEPATGDLFVLEYDERIEGNALDKLKPNGSATPELVQRLTASDVPGSNPGNWARAITVDSSNNLYVLDEGDLEVLRFLPEAFPHEGDTFEEAVSTLASEPYTLTTDPTSGDVFLGYPGSIGWYGYDPSSTPPGKLTLAEEFFSTNASPTRPGSPSGLAVSPAGVVYAADIFPDGIDDFELNFLGGPPAVSTCTTSSITASSATLEGTVTPPEGHATTYRFEYGATTPAEGPVTRSAAAPSVETEVTGLHPNTTYHDRLVENGPFGEEHGHYEEATFTTGPDATTAKLTGALTRLHVGSSAGYHFEYGESTATASAGSGTSPVAVSANVTGLTPVATYYCRIVASAAGGEAESVNEQFTTHVAVADVTTSAATDVTSEGAVLNGALAPEGVPAEYFFEYGATSAYGHETAAETSSSSGEAQVTEAIAGLEPLSTYHYRLATRRVIEGKTYETYGADEAFNTNGAAPEVQSESASNVGSFSAQLQATINPANSATSYYFLYGTSPNSEQAFVPAGSIAGNGSIQATPETIQALKPGTIYYYHVVVENAFGKVEGPRGSEEKSFQTLPAHSPDVALAPPGEVTQTTATLSVTLNPQGLPTVYKIDLTIDGADLLVAAQSAGEGSGPQTSTYVLSGLIAGTTYQVRVLARNEAGEVESQVQSFATTSSSVFVLAQPPTPTIAATPTFAPEKPTTPTIKPKSLTNAQKLAKALKACKRKPKSKRASCEKQARKKYARR